MRLQCVEVVRIEAEQLPAVLHDEADITRHNLRAEAMIVALNERAAVAIFIDNRQVNCVTLAEDRVSGIDVRCSFLHVDACSLVIAVLFRNQLGGGQLVEVGIGVELCSVGKSQLLRFDKEVNQVRRIVSHSANIKPFDHVQHFQSGDALAVRWQFPHVVASVVRRNGINPLRRVICEIFHREVTTVNVAEVDNLPGDPALVERVPTAFGDCSIAVREVRVSEEISFAWCFAAFQVRLRRV